MPDNETVARAAVPAIRDQRNVGEACAHDGCTSFELLRHARTSFGAFVAHDDDDIFAVRELTGIEGSVELVFFVEDLFVS
jgi:hypothetical protein